MRAQLDSLLAQELVTQIRLAQIEQRHRALTAELARLERALFRYRHSDGPLLLFISLGILVLLWFVGRAQRDLRRRE